MRRFGRGESRLELRVGEKVAIELEAVLTAGFEWRLDTAPSGAISVRDEEPVATTGTIGGSSSQSFVLEAREPGRATVEFVYGRPWQDKVHERHTVQVEVKSAGRASKRSPRRHR